MEKDSPPGDSQTLLSIFNGHLSSDAYFVWKQRGRGGGKRERRGEKIQNVPKFYCKIFLKSFT